MDNQTKITTKLKVMEMEEKNLSRLIIFDSTNGFAKIAGHSAIFYAGNIAKRIGRRCLLRPDSDHYAKSEDGVVSVKYNTDLVERLEAIEIMLDDKESSEHIHIFRFKVPFSEQDLEFYRRQLLEDSRKIEKTLLVQSPIPTLYADIRDLNEIIYRNSEQMPELGKMVIGADLLRLANFLSLKYIQAANEGLTEIKAGEMLKAARKIKYQMKNIDNLRLISARNNMRILELIIKIESILVRATEGSRK
ncbi:hypothetical protein IJF86_00875 [Candidatus Saccharibacteria bacterium]|nr:hypothetical protein [Candidatus Saccharibacteria bacterium]